MTHPRDRHLESQNRANANIHTIAHTDTKIASTGFMNAHSQCLSKKNKNTQQQNVTLDKLHQSYVAKLNEDKQNVHELDSQLKDLRQQYNALKTKDMSELSNIQLQRLFTLENEIQIQEKNIKSLRSNDTLTDYFMETGDILFEYYDNLRSISKGDDDRRKRSLASYQKQSAETVGTTKKTVIDFFRPLHATSSTTDQNNTKNPADETDTKNVEESKPAPPEKHRYMSRQVLLQKYLEKTNPNEVNSTQMYALGDTSDIDRCPECNTERVLMQQEALLICPNVNCMCTDNVLIDSNIPSYKDNARENTSYYSYKRINHFNEWLAQFQAKETTDIPEDVYNSIYIELKKERISNMAKVTPTKMKEILKRLKLNKYYEHIPHITNRLNGQPAPVITRATEEKLRTMFKEIQGPFMKHCPPERKNFLSYSYVLHKFCQLLELDDFLKCFQLLKSREKLHVQDTIWEKICAELHWEFIKSV